jgi:hypothetical protein
MFGSERQLRAKQDETACLRRCASSGGFGGAGLVEAFLYEPLCHCNPGHAPALIHSAGRLCAPVTKGLVEGAKDQDIRCCGVVAQHIRARRHPKTTLAVLTVTGKCLATIVRQSAMLALSDKILQIVSIYGGREGRGYERTMPSASRTIRRKQQFRRSSVLRASVTVALER